MSKLTVGDIREPVIRLALVMEEKLRKHDEERGPRGWICDSTTSLWKRVMDESKELRQRISELAICLGVHQTRDIDSDEIQKKIDLVIEECADVANYSMMIADVVSGLGEPQAKKDIPGIDEVAAMQAKKIAFLVYTSNCRPEKRFFACMVRSLEFQGWEMDLLAMTMKEGNMRITIESMEHLLPRDREFVGAFIGEDAANLVFDSFGYVEKLVAEEAKKEV